MTVQISKSEMRLLGYLHEHAKGYDQRFSFNPRDAWTALGIDQDQLQRDTSFLNGHGLAGIRTINMTTFNQKSHTLAEVWLTSQGENLMRQLEADLEAELMDAPDYRPNVGVRLTVAAAAFVYDTARAVVVAKVAALL